MTQSYVYFIRAGLSGPVKIGYSKNPFRRLIELQSGNADKLRLLAIHPGGAGLEKSLHRYFADCRALNEWFDPTDEMLDLIDNVRELVYWVADPEPEVDVQESA